MNEPADPITELAAAAVQLHELYEAFMEAGFTDRQALELVMTAMQGSAG